ncbi:hypothetical protein Vadar_003398 [Vaccinium darrowii]|nr:hypothetical protein Vadar_003398 [Vaccinium darrowii]
MQEALDHEDMDVDHFDETVEFMTKGAKKSSTASTSLTLSTSQEVSNSCDESPKGRRERKPKESVLEEDAPEPPRQVRILKKAQPVVKRQESTAKRTQLTPTKLDSGGKVGLNPLAKEFRPNASFTRTCNMVFIFEEGLEAKDGQQQVMEVDVIEMGETAKILNESMRHVNHVSSVTILEEEAAKEASKAATCVMFEKPSPKAANHIKPLYVSGCLDGMLVNRLSIDSGSVANLMPRTMMTKLRKTNQDLIASSASLSDFTRGLNVCQGILIMKLTIEARLYDFDIGPMRVVGPDKYDRHKIVPLALNSSNEDLKKVCSELIGLEFHRAITPSIQISSNASLEEVEGADKSDVIRFKDLETTPTKLDDLKADVQDPLDEVNVGSKEDPKPIYVSQLLPEDIKERFEGV